MSTFVVPYFVGDGWTKLPLLHGLNCDGLGLFFLDTFLGHHYFRHRKQLALVIEHFSGGSLAQRLLDKQPVDAQVWVNKVVQWTLQLCNTLAVVHAKRLVHRDIKPPNILLRDGMAVIVNFGIVNITGGTVIYSSPDKRVRLACQDNARGDIYALSVTLLKLLNREHP